MVRWVRWVCSLQPVEQPQLSAVVRESASVRVSSVGGGLWEVVAERKAVVGM